MSGWNGRRLGALEAENPACAKVTVLEAPVGQEERVVSEYYRDTPEELWAELVVVISLFSKQRLAGEGLN